MVRTVDYMKFLSRSAKRREPSAIRSLQPLMKLEGMISLGGGLPNPKSFPFESAMFTLKDGTTVNIAGDDMKTALQYSNTDGLPGLVSWINELQQRYHNPPLGPSEWTIGISNGSQEAMAKVFEMLIDEGDSVLVEEPCYSGALAALKPIGPNLFGVQTDRNGMIPESLESLLANWPATYPFPRCVYLIPIGQNPSGSSLSLERKEAIYQIASKYDLIIIEDDPYYWMEFGHGDSSEFFLPTPSFLSMDVDGRVLRLDSFSKILSSGMRLGWLTGPKPLMERFNFAMQVSALHPCNLSQAAILAVLKVWQQTGFENHITSVRNMYRERREHMMRAAAKHLTGLAEFDAPSAGMFLWIKLTNIVDSKALIETKARDKKVLMVPGGVFLPANYCIDEKLRSAASPSNYVRASFSVASVEDMETAVSRLAELLREEQKSEAGPSAAH